VEASKAVLVWTFETRGRQPIQHVIVSAFLSAPSPLEQKQSLEKEALQEFLWK
jgi:hypothetical protein